MHIQTRRFLVQQDRKAFVQKPFFTGLFLVGGDAAL